MTHDLARPAMEMGARSGSRREFLGAMTCGITAAAIGAGSKTASAAGPPNDGAFVATGDADPRLAAYDSLMMDFMLKYRPPGAALAVSKDGRLVYARGFGFADVERREPARPLSLFRIASISKPFTSTAVFQLVQQGRLRLDDKVFAILKLQPFLERGARLDERIHAITVHHCLQHTAGWDRDKGFDPMGAAATEEVAHALGVPSRSGPSTSSATRWAGRSTGTPAPNTPTRISAIACSAASSRRRRACATRTM
jgi:CubicO group peptidase (beta-lactamase class C family)